MRRVNDVTELKLVHEEFSSDVTLLIVSLDRSSKKESTTAIHLSGFSSEILITNYKQFFHPSS